MASDIKKQKAELLASEFNLYLDSLARNINPALRVNEVDPRKDIRKYTSMDQCMDAKMGDKDIRTEKRTDVNIDAFIDVNINANIDARTENEDQKVDQNTNVRNNAMLNLRPDLDLDNNTGHKRKCMIFTSSGHNFITRKDGAYIVHLFMESKKMHCSNNIEAWLTSYLSNKDKDVGEVEIKNGELDVFNIAKLKGFASVVLNRYFDKNGGINHNKKSNNNVVNNQDKNHDKNHVKNHDKNYENNYDKSHENYDDKNHENYYDKNYDVEKHNDKKFDNKYDNDKIYDKNFDKNIDFYAKDDDIALQKISVSDDKPPANPQAFSCDWTNEMVDNIVGNIFKDDDYQKIQTTPIELNFPEKINHASVRPFVCHYKMCNRAFKRFEHLKRHYRIHTGERPFKCKYPGCHKAFARSDNLNQHLRVHSSEASVGTGTMDLRYRDVED